jgi:hypothetical protein
MGALPQALQIIFEVQTKRSNEKNNKKKNELFNLQNTFYFYFSSLWTPLTFKPHNLFYFFHFK